MKNMKKSITIKLNQKFNNGFTLIELIIVIAIIGILAAILIPRYTSFVEKSNAAVCTSNRSNLQGLYADCIAEGNAVVNLTNQTLEAYLTGKNLISSNYSTCPSGGTITWSLGPGGLPINGVCSIASHNGLTTGNTALIFTADKWFRMQSGNLSMINSYLTGGGVNVVIPPTISGTAVTTIGLNAFNGKSLESVIIPVGITSIMSSAFQSNSITKIEIPKDISIAGNAFRNNPLTEITIGTNVTINSSSFRTTATTYPSAGWDYGFKTLYDSAAGGEGTYIFNDTTKKWVKQT